MLRSLALFALLGLPLLAETPERVEITVREKAEPVTIDPRLFGQFLERTREPVAGVESAVQEDGKLPPATMEMIQRMQIPVIRFPGGTTVDEDDWTDMIDHVPGREGPRPITYFAKGHSTPNRFGLDEYFALRDQLHCETILVVNMLDAFSKKVPLEDAATKAAGLLAYANAEVGAKLPAGMPDWPAARATNGHPAPFHADYIQFGNEWFIEEFKDAVTKGTGLKDPLAIADWYIVCLKAYLEKVRAIDPNIPIIIDGVTGLGIGATTRILADPFIRANVRYTTYHSYGPGAVDKLTKDGQPYANAKMSKQDFWNQWVTTPGDYADGVGMALGSRFEVARALGYHIACTEWNWNGFGFERLNAPAPINHALPSALGAAAYVNGMLRQAASLTLATQSNLLGGWNIAAVQGKYLDPRPLNYSPMERVITLYNKHHGKNLLDCDVKGTTTFNVTVTPGWGKAPACPVTDLEAVATTSPGMLYFHIINRNIDKAVPVHLDAKALGLVKGKGTHYLLTGDPKPVPKSEGPDTIIQESTTPVTIASDTLYITVPARSVNIYELPIGH